MFGLRTLFAFIAPHDCLACGRQGSLLCAVCRIKVPPADPVTPPSPLVHLSVGANYDGVVKQVLHLYKFERARDAAVALAWIMGRSLPRLPSSLVVTYIPTANKRVRQRGYDQARWLALELAKQKGWSVRSLLIRSGHGRQVGSSRLARQQQARQSYAVRPGAEVGGLPVLLIDDIMTTGSTLQAAAEVLMANGAASVCAVVVAYKNKTSP